MITKSEARELVSRKICEENSDLSDNDEFIILDEHTIEKSWGWVFFYTSKKWHETKDIKYVIAGNAPIIVEKDTSNSIITGTARSTEHYIENYEHCGNPHG